MSNHSVVPRCFVSCCIAYLRNSYHSISPRIQAIDEKEYGQAMLNAYKQTSDHDFDTWVENMLHTKQWDKGALQEAGVEWHSKSFHGTNDDDGPRVDNVALDHEAHLEENKRRRLTAKLKGVENWGEKLGFTSDHHHYHAPEYEPPIAPVNYKHAHCDATAATKIQTHVRGKIAKKKTSEKKARRDSELKAAKTKKPHSHNHHHHHHDS